MIGQHRGVIQLAIAVTFFVAACAGRENLTKRHGESYKAYANRQAAKAPVKAGRAVDGLDSQEATIIAESYRRSLAPKGEKTEAEPVIIVPQQAMQRQPLAPSVPKER